MAAAPNPSVGNEVAQAAPGEDTADGGASGGQSLARSAKRHPGRRRLGCVRRPDREENTTRRGIRRATLVTAVRFGMKKREMAAPTVLANPSATRRESEDRKRRRSWETRGWCCERELRKANETRERRTLAHLAGESRAGGARQHESGAASSRNTQTEDEKPRATRRHGALGKRRRKRHSGCGGVNRETKQITTGTLAPHGENQLGRASARVRRRPKHKQAREEFLQEEKSGQQLRPTIWTKIKAKNTQQKFSDLVPT
jgi:hypothetical protein